MKTRYFLNFTTLLNHPRALDAVVMQTRQGWKLSAGANALYALSEEIHESPGQLAHELGVHGYVEVDEPAFEAALVRPWELYAYRAYITGADGDAYLKSLRDWSGYDGGPVVQETDPATPDENLALSRALVRDVRMDKGFFTGVLIFPYLGDVVASLTLEKQLVPWWNSVACAGRDLPATISPTELETYAPFMAHVGTNQSGAVISYYDDDED